MSREKISVKAECENCGSTGLYAGINCTDGTAVFSQKKRPLKVAFFIYS